jgi:hypothetical protein
VAITDSVNACVKIFSLEGQLIQLLGSSDVVQVAVMVDNLSNVQENIKDTKGVIKSRRRMQWTKEKRTKSQTMVDEILQKTKD